METTYERNVVAEERSKLHSINRYLALSLRDPEPRRTLAMLAGVWAEAEAHLPIAIVVSIYDDLLARAAEEPGELEPLAPERVVVDEGGVARVFGERPSVAAIASSFVRALGSSDAVPPRAWAFVARIEEEVAFDAETVREWIRETFGAPAPHEEVAAAFRAIEILFEQPMPVDAIAAADTVETELVAPSALPAVESALGASSDPAPDFDLPILSAIPAPSPAAPSPASVAPLEVQPEADEAPTLPPAPARPVIRHQLPRPNASVTSAPAARRSARPALDDHDLLALDSDRFPWKLWAIAALFAAIFALFWFEIL